MSERLLHHALLRPAIIQILRAQGFSGAKPSVVDTFTDIAARYITLLATSALTHAHAHHDEPGLDVTDVRMAMLECGMLQPSTTASQEAWREILRRPIHDIPDRNDLQDTVMATRDEEDTQDITAFARFFRSNAFREIVRVAGLVPDEDAAATAVVVATEGEKRKPQNYLALLKKKQSKTGEGSKFQGTLLGSPSEMRGIKIDGATGLPESIEEWGERVKQRSKKLAAMKQTGDEKGVVVWSVETEMEDVG